MTYFQAKHYFNWAIFAHPQIGFKVDVEKIAKWSLAVREWICGCGQKHDRDINAATNTHIEGMRLH
ncbi:zinc ribbon domain-containing protein [Xenorhabdus bovienii]|uniref:zinc ribbon domain-containing protein n=1 Tax=Xenorhabdus bovienii TaxID=40576 RepID=UPI003DA5B89F